MSNFAIDMSLFGGSLLIDVKLWSKKINAYKTVSLTLDTGASVTVISSDILFRLGYNVALGKDKVITTASDVIYVKEISIENLKIGNYESGELKLYAHSFPSENFTCGVIGLDILSQFDINLLFSKRKVEFTYINQN